MRDTPYSLRPALAVGAADLDDLPLLPSLKVKALKGQTVLLSLLMRSTSTVDATVTLGALPANIDVEVRHVCQWVTGTGAWGGDVNPGNDVGMLCPTYLFNDPDRFPVNVSDPDPSNWSQECIDDNDQRILMTDKTKVSGVIRHRDSEQTATTWPWPYTDATELRPVNIPAGEVRQLYIIVEVGETAAAGVHTFDITVNGVVATATVTVLAGTLAASDKTHALYYKGAIQPGAKADPYQTADGRKDVTRHQQDVALQRRLGMNQIVREQLDQENETEYKEALESIGDAGFPTDDFYNVQLASLDNTRAQGDVDNTRRLMGETNYSYTNIHFMGLDERTGAEIDAQFGLWDEQIANDAKIWVTAPGNQFLSGTDDENAARLKDRASTVVLSGAAHPDLSHEVHNNWNIPGAKIFNYFDPQSGAFTPEKCRANYGWGNHAGQADGFFVYAFQDTFGSAWRDMDCRYGTLETGYQYWRSLMLAMDTIAGPVPGMNAWGLNQAVMDSRVITTLEAAIAADPTNQASIAAQTWLTNTFNEIADGIPLGAGWYSPVRPVYDPQYLTDMALSHWEAITNPASLPAGTVIENEPTPLDVKGVLLESASDASLMFSFALTASGTCTEVTSWPGGIRRYYFDISSGTAYCQSTCTPNDPAAALFALFVVRMDDLSEPRIGTTGNTNADVYFQMTGTNMTATPKYKEYIGDGMWLYGMLKDVAGDPGALGIYSHSNMSGKKFSAGLLTATQDQSGTVSSVPNMVLSSGMQSNVTRPAGALKDTLTTTEVGTLSNDFTIELELDVPQVVSASGAGTDPNKLSRLQSGGVFWAEEKNATGKGIDIHIPGPTTNIFQVRCASETAATETLTFGDNMFDDYPIHFEIIKSDEGIRVIVNYKEGDPDADKSTTNAFSDDMLIDNLHYGRNKDGATANVVVKSVKVTLAA